MLCQGSGCVSKLLLMRRSSFSRYIVSMRGRLQAAIGIVFDFEQVDPAAHRCPAAPAVIGSSLPDVPERAVGSPGEHLQAAIGILRDFQQVDPTTHGCPTTPAVTGSGLPL